MERADRVFFLNLEKVKEYIAVEGRFPPGHYYLNSCTYASFSNRIRKTYKGGGLSDLRFRALKEIGFIFYPRSEVIEFRVGHRR